MRMEAFERKVRPIYDALDARNWKGATKLANSALNKFKNHPLLKTLKAVGLDRLGKSEEAFQVCEEVRATVPTDDHILHTLCIVYRSTGNLDCLTKAYAAACAKEPSNRELLEGLFGCYVREGLYSEQQQVAMKIYKQNGTEKYLWWVVMSLLLQAWAEKSGIKSPMGVDQTLKLAVSMVGRHIKGKGKLESKEALLVYIDILHSQGVPDMALECLRGELGDLCPLTREKLQLQAQCYLHMGQWEEAACKFKEMLVEDPDDFELLEAYLDCVLPGTSGRFSQYNGWMALHREASQLSFRLRRKDDARLDASDENKLEEAKDTVASVANSLLSGQSSAASTSLVLSLKRSAGLARMELIGRMLKLGACTETEMVEEIMGVFSDGRDHLALELLKNLPGEDTLKDYQFRLTAHQVLAGLGFPHCKSLEELCNIADSCTKMFFDSLHYTHGLDIREVGPIDNAIGVAVSALMHAHQYSLQDSACLWKALVTLAAAIDKRPFNGRLNLDICSLYGLLGAPLLALEHLERMEIKYIQMGSLASHLIVPTLLAYNQNSCARRLLIETILLFEEHTKDAGETIFTAYQKGTFTKIIEFLDFKESLDLSHTHYCVLAEEGILRLTETPGTPLNTISGTLKDVCSGLSLEAVRDSNLQRVRFNEDLESRASWFAPSIKSPKLAIREWWERWGSGVTSYWDKAHVINYQEHGKQRINRRWLLPHVLQGMWLTGDINAAKQALSVLLDGVEITWTGVESQLGDGLQSLQEESLQLTTAYELYQDATLSMGTVMASAVLVGENHTDEAPQTYVEIWTKMVDLLCKEMQSPKSCDQGVDTIIGALINEEIPWITISLQFWLKKLQNTSNVHVEEEHTSQTHALTICRGISGPLAKLLDHCASIHHQMIDGRLDLIMESIVNCQSIENKPWLPSLENNFVRQTIHAVLKEQQKSWIELSGRGAVWAKVLLGLQD